MTASFVTNAISPASALGSRAPFGVKGVVSGAADAVGGRVVSPATAFAREATGSDRTLLVAALLTASAAIGAVLGAIGPRGSGASAGEAR